MDKPEGLQKIAYIHLYPERPLPKDSRWAPYVGIHTDKNQYQFRNVPAILKEVVHDPEFFGYDIFELRIHIGNLNIDMMLSKAQFRGMAQAALQQQIIVHSLTVISDILLGERTITRTNILPVEEGGADEVENPDGEVDNSTLTKGQKAN